MSEEVKAIDKINEHTITPLTEDDIFTFDVILCDNDVDRVYDKMTSEFLQEFKEKSGSLVGLKDHDWNTDTSTNRLYDVELIESEDEKTSLGENRQYLLGHAYTLKSNPDVERINAGLLSGVSVSFNSSGDHCSICGGTTHKGEDDVAVCVNGHHCGETYDGKLCYNVLCHCDDVFEWSLTPVPAQRNARVKNKNLGGVLMKKAKFLASKLFKSKALDENVKTELEEIIETPGEEEVSEEDVLKLIEENNGLKTELEVVKKELEEVKSKMAKAKACGAIEKAVDGLEPLTEQVKADILEKIDADKVTVNEDGEVVGLDEQIEAVKKSYAGLFKSKAAEEVKEDLKEEVKLEEKNKSVNKGFNPTFGVGMKAAASKKSFHDACSNM